MRLIEFWKRIDMTRLDELFIRYKTPGNHDDYNLIAHRENIWLYTKDDNDNEELVADIQQRTGLLGGDLNELFSESSDRGDLVVGTYHPSKDEFWQLGDPGEMTHNPAVSQYFKKLMSFLGVEKISGERLSGDEHTGVEMMQHEMHGKIPEEMYHGTNTTAIPSIMRIGLVPGEGEGNWNEVGQFYDIIFIAQDYYYAKFHAERQSNQLGKGAPVILKVKVPDPSKIVPDFDVLTHMGGNSELADRLNYSGAGHYYADHVQKQREELEKYNKGTDLTMISGIVGYQGRIPANHIIGISAALAGDLGDPDKLDYHEFNDANDFIKALNIYDNHGYWYEGIAEEIAQQDEEDEDY